MMQSSTSSYLVLYRIDHHININQKRMGPNPLNKDNYDADCILSKLCMCYIVAEREIKVTSNQPEFFILVAANYY